MQLFTLSLLLLAFRVNSTVSNLDKFNVSEDDKPYMEINSGSGEDTDPAVVVGGSGDITMPTQQSNSGSGEDTDPVVVVGGSGEITMPTHAITVFNEINNPIVNPTTMPNVNKPPVINADLLIGMTKGCLPSISKIHRYTGEIVPITELKMWDPVMIDSENASLVFYLMQIFGSHTDTDNAFLKFTTAEGVIHVSASTMLYVNDDIAAAYTVKKNDFLIRENGTATPVLKIEEVYLPGLFSPYTMHGDIVIDGFRVLTKVSEKQIKKRSLLTPVHDILKFLVSKRELENVMV